MSTIRDYQKGQYIKINELNANEIEDLYFRLMMDEPSNINTMLLDKCEKNYRQITGNSLTKVVRDRIGVGNCLPHEAELLLRAINDVENIMERWHLGRSNDDDTLNNISNALYNVGRLRFFVKK